MISYDVGKIEILLLGLDVISIGVWVHFGQVLVGGCDSYFHRDKVFAVLEYY